jgi:hypothetical protein
LFSSLERRDALPFGNDFHVPSYQIGRSRPRSVLLELFTDYGSDPLVAVDYSNVFARRRRCRGVAWRPAAGFATLGGVDGTIDLIRLDPFSQFQKACTPRIPVLPGYAAVMRPEVRSIRLFEDFQSPSALIARHRRTALATTQVDAQLEN